MCRYVKVNKCSITDDVCPFMYFCNKVNDWRPLKSMPENCKVQGRIEVPKGCYKVRMERKGKLYVDINGQTIKVANPFDHVPQFVKAYQLKSGAWRVKK